MYLPNLLFLDLVKENQIFCITIKYELFLGFWLGVGWGKVLLGVECYSNNDFSLCRSGVLDIYNLRVTHIHCPPPAWL